MDSYLFTLVSVYCKSEEDPSDFRELPGGERQYHGF